MEFSDPMMQHIFGIVDHGRGIFVYRTFPNIKNDCNATIHSLLLHLRDRLNENKFLPPTMYIQIDGGPDLANKIFYSIISLLVAKGVGGLRKIVVTRLPVGHTHEVYYTFYCVYC